MRPISKELSVYLNLARWCAAAAVVLYHLRIAGFGSVWINGLLPAHGQACVMIFFVISGFVIAYTIDVRRLNGPLGFLLDRAFTASQYRFWSFALYLSSFDPIFLQDTPLFRIQPFLFLLTPRF